MKKYFEIMIVCFTLMYGIPAVSAQEDVVCRDDFSRMPDVAHVAFMGGSITEMDGYRPMVCEMLKEKFPETRFTFLAAGIASTCSDTGAFRLERDVFSEGSPDLFFVEFAVNDDQDGHFTREKSIRGMEGIIRHVLRENPDVKIVMTFFVNEHLMDEYRAGREAVSIAAHRAVAEHYGVSTVNVAREVQQQIDEKTLTWEQFGGVHPAPYGNRLAANMIAQLFTSRENVPASQKKSKALPEPLDKFNYEYGWLFSPGGAANEDWTWGVPDWKNIPGAFRQTFAGQECLCAEKPGAAFTHEFRGTAVGFYVLAGPDAGVLEYTVDDGPPQQMTLFHEHSRGLHYPRTVIFADELPPGKHTLHVKLTDIVPEGSRGTAVRILRFVENTETIQMTEPQQHASDQVQTL